MASSSQLPTSPEKLNDQNPSTAGNPIHPDPASSPQSNSIDAPFSTEAVDAVVDSLMSEGKKRGREGDAVVEETPQVQRRRFTRNPRIGLGFHNQPEDPVLVGDEVGASQSGGNEESGGPDVTLVGVQTGSFAAFHDGRIIPDSVCTVDMLNKL